MHIISNGFNECIFWFQVFTTWWRIWRVQCGVLCEGFKRNGGYLKLMKFIWKELEKSRNTKKWKASVKKSWMTHFNWVNWMKFQKCGKEKKKLEKNIWWSVLPEHRIHHIQLIFTALPMKIKDNIQLQPDMKLQTGRALMLTKSKRRMFWVTPGNSQRYGKTPLREVFRVLINLIWMEVGCQWHVLSPVKGFAMSAMRTNPLT